MSDESQTMTVQDESTTMISGALLQKKMLEEAEREERLADEPLGPERPTGEDYVAFFEAAELEVGDRFVWDFDGEASEVMAIFDARHDGLIADEGDTLVHYSTPEEEGTQADSAESVGRSLAEGTIRLEDA